MSCAHLFNDGFPDLSSKGCPSSPRYPPAINLLIRITSVAFTFPSAFTSAASVFMDTSYPRTRITSVISTFVSPFTSPGTKLSTTVIFPFSIVRLTGFKSLSITSPSA